MQEPEPDFALSGKLAAETNRVNGVVMLHVEPPEAAVPTQRWRLYQVISNISEQQKTWRKPPNVALQKGSRYGLGARRR